MARYGRTGKFVHAFGARKDPVEARLQRGEWHGNRETRDADDTRMSEDDMGFWISRARKLLTPESAKKLGFGELPSDDDALGWEMMIDGFVRSRGQRELVKLLGINGELQRKQKNEDFDGYMEMARKPIKWTGSENDDDPKHDLVDLMKMLADFADQAKMVASFHRNEYAPLNELAELIGRCRNDADVIYRSVGPEDGDWSA